MPDMKLNLYENAIDSIKHALEHYTSDSDLERRYKYTILHLSQGVNLLLKERLSMEHPNFIYKDVAKPEGKTIDVYTTIERLKGIIGLDLGDAEIAIRNLAKDRNQIEHAAISITKQRADNIIGQIVPFLVVFVNEILGRRFILDPAHKDILLNIEGYRQGAKRAAKSMIKNKDATGVFCEACQDTTAIYTSEQDGLTSYSVQCLACLEQIEHGVLCQECGQKNKGQIHPHLSYCAKCRNKIVSEFRFTGYSEHALFAAEVRRWFQNHDYSITYNEMWHMVRNISMAGSSSPSFIQTLYDNGVIDFDHPSDKKIYEAKLRSGVHKSSGHFNLNDRFKWTWDDDARPTVDATEPLPKTP
ncbi:MAG: hypothetical protein IAF02_19235 [Anaerolineae bacterium]|nr:hypothetical protein [Anaerolineae bacterium]